MNLKYTLADAMADGTAPWKDPVQEDFHVAIFAGAAMTEMTITTSDNIL